MCCLSCHARQVVGRHAVVNRKGCTDRPSRNASFASLDVIKLIWLFQFNDLSITKPINSVDSTLSIVTSLIRNAHVLHL